MKWRTIDDYHAESDCGRYTVCRIQIDRERTYEAWLKGTRNQPSQIIEASCATAKQAQQACEAHAAKKEGKGE